MNAEATCNAIQRRMLDQRSCRPRCCRHKQPPSTRANRQPGCSPSPEASPDSPRQPTYRLPWRLIGWFNIAALVVATASRDGFLPVLLGRHHPRYGSPHCAVISSPFLSIALPIAMIFCTQSEPIQSTIDLTNVMVLLWLIPNGLICAAAVRRFDGQDRRGATEVLAAVQVVAVAILAGVSLLRPINRESGVVDALGAVMIAVASVLFFKLGNEKRAAAARARRELRSLRRIRAERR